MEKKRRFLFFSIIKPHLSLNFNPDTSIIHCTKKTIKWLSPLYRFENLLKGMKLDSYLTCRLCRCNSHDAFAIRVNTTSPIAMAIVAVVCNTS